jgi:adenylate cyclase, class 2
MRFGRWRETDSSRRHRDLRSLETRSCPRFRTWRARHVLNASFSRNAHAQASAWSAATPVRIGRVEQARRNIELKASDPDPERSLQACVALGADDHGVVSQRDIYFEVARGGLKLREETPGRPHLIQLERARAREQRESRYRIVEVDDVAVLRAALAASLGVRGEVVKRRHLFLWHDVRIHLDQVEHLGTFIELEAVAPAESDLSNEHRLVAELRVALGITDERLVALGYAEQLLRSQ